MEDKSGIERWQPDLPCLAFARDLQAVIAFCSMSSQPPTRPAKAPQSSTQPPRPFSGLAVHATTDPTRLLVIGGLLVAFALRLHRLGAESLWYDETVSVFLAQLSIPQLVAHTARDIHPPGYYLLLHVWGWLSGPTLYTGLEFLYAWPSLFWGVLLLPLLFALGRYHFSRQVASLALILSAVNPWHLWYSQEVRMYSLGAGLGLLCLWAARGWWQKSGTTAQASLPCSPPASQRSLLLYALAAAAGLYTLYYFAFLLIGLNLLVLWRYLSVRLSAHRALHRTQSVSHRVFRLWLAANGLAFLLWLPWLPIFWRQISQPPVPVWRYGLELMGVLEEGLAALVIGQSPPGGLLWPWAAAGGLLVLLFLLFGSQRKKGEVWAVAGFVVLPPLLIVLASLTLTPLYHIRYFFTYTAGATLLLALLLEWTARRSRWLYAISLAALLAASGWSVAEFWTNPLYRADDHRGAVAELARSWRPGDGVLVNAGWVHTALAVYWPPAPSPDGAQPLAAPAFKRLSAAGTQDSPGLVDEQPVLWVGGSVDGPKNLGWGLAESDFYAISQAETVRALGQAAARHPRIWHYRLYDTVSDPDGIVRGWLDTHAAQRLDLPFAGRDFLRLQLYETPATADPARCPTTTGSRVIFGEQLALTSAAISPISRSGSTLYTVLCWEIGPGVALENLRTSLRLYRPADGDAGLMAQKDESPFAHVTTRSNYRAALALPIPAATPPGDYRLELIVYDGRTGEPLPIAEERAIFGQRWPLAERVLLGPAQTK